MSFVFTFYRVIIDSRFVLSCLKTEYGHLSMCILTCKFALGPIYYISYQNLLVAGALPYTVAYTLTQESVFTTNHPTISAACSVSIITLK